MKAARVPKILKPNIRREATFTSSAGAFRGMERQRAGKVKLGRLGDPRPVFRRMRSKARREDISGVLLAGESERSVVAPKRGNFRGAKGPWQKRSGLRKTWS